MSTVQRSLVLHLSRPKTWLYLLGPFFIGVAAAPEVNFSMRLVLIGLFFTFPANLLIYGFDEIFKRGIKSEKQKQSESIEEKRQHTALLNILMGIGLVGMLLVYPESVPDAAKWAMTGFYFLSLGYSVPPVRAKSRPILDVYFATYCLMPGLASYGLLTTEYPPLPIIVAGIAWCAATYAYLSVSTIRADKKSGIKTTAATLGSQKTFIFCSIHYLIAAVLVHPWVGSFSVIAGLVYAWLMYASFKSRTKNRLTKLHSYFPSLNLVLGVMLILWIILYIH